MSNLKMYFFGTEDGKYIKMGKTEGDFAARRKSILAGQMNSVQLHFLCGVRMIASSCEAQLVGRNGKGGHFDHLRAPFHSKETFHAEPELVEYINWLRQQSYAWLQESGGPDAIPEFDDWRPDPERRLPLQHPDPDALFHLYEGPLADTPWEMLSIPEARFNDYYTPPSIVRQAAEAMGGIDLDAASNEAANRIHQIPDYFHAYRSAFHNKWHGRVWLNPPYGNNGPWIEQVVRYLRSGDVTQLCFFSPMNAFMTRYARELYLFRPAFLLFSPTPTFWGQNKKGVRKGWEACETAEGQRRDSTFGTDMPHGILYFGDRKAQFAKAFRNRGPIWLEMEGWDGPG